MTTTPFSAPTDVIAAATHPDPYPWYGELTARGPVTRADDGAWLVTGSAAITAAFHDPALRTRPIGEAVPAALLGTTAGATFARLVRMTDDPASRTVKAAMARAIAGLPEEPVAAAIVEAVGAAWRDAATEGQPDWPMTAVFGAPVAAMAALLGPGDIAPRELTALVRRFAAMIAPPPFTGSVAAGIAATRVLMDAFTASLDRGAPSGFPLLDALREQLANDSAEGRATLIANAIGMLFQSLDATAALTATALRRLARWSALARTIQRDPGGLDAVLAETLRHDPPVQNTRRFATAAISIAGVSIPAGGRVILVIPTATRDPAVHPDPDRFAPDRFATGSGERVAPVPTFGIGPHACPGQRLAWTIAVASVRAGLAAGMAAPRENDPVGFVPSPNSRIPILSAPGPADRHRDRRNDRAADLPLHQKESP